MRFADLPNHTPATGKKISLQALKTVLEECGIEYLVALPESPYELFLKDIAEHSTIRIIQVTREAEGMAICAGLTYGGGKAAWLGSYKGFYNSLDTLIGTARRVQASFLILISDEEIPPARAVHDPEMGRYAVALARAIGLPCLEVRTTEELARVRQAMEQTTGGIQPVAVALYF
ncbi:MAG: hypothetical protein HY671_09425 [Chloroflexi bacterium]|nr:hypothetical protein [Chloroflexota bacterium]